MPNSIPSTALLALKRFVRGPLRQMGIGVVSLMLILGMSVQVPTEESAKGVTEHTMSNTALANTTLAVQSTQQTTAVRPISNGTAHTTSHQLSKPSQLLSAHMTHHRLTSARFSIPARGKRTEIASLATTK